MRLLAIRPVNFRAFGRSDWIPLDSDLVVCHGRNGSGKTSLAEALEWLLFGETRRRERGEGFSKTEYKGSYANVHADGDVEVSARVRLGDGTVHTLTRRLSTGRSGVENSRTYLDDQPNDFVSLGIPAGGDYYPVVTQHGLQDFIHAGPKERRDAFNAMLGLESLSSFKTALDRARLSFQRSAPPEVAAARTELNGTRQLLRHHEGTATIAKRWDEDFKGMKLDWDWPALVGAAQEELGTGEADPDRLAGLLNSRRKATVESVLGGEGAVWANLPPHAAAIRALQPRLVESLSALFASAERFQATGLERLPSERLAFWRAGLRMVDKSSPDCPMCEQPTLTDEKRASLEARLSAHRLQVDTEQELLATARRAQSLAAELRDHVSAVAPPLPDRIRWEEIENLAPASHERLAGYRESRDDLRAERGHLETVLSATEESLRPLAAGTADPVQLENHLEYVRSAEFQEAARQLLPVIEAAERLAALFAEIERAMGTDLSSSAEVQRLDALIAGLATRPHLLVIAAHNQLRDAAATESHALEEFIQAKQQAMLARVEAVIQGYYDLLNPGSASRFSRLEPATGAIRLLAESFGEEMSAAACLSSCQLNCLGLAIHLVRATRSGSPFGFIVLDDPFQAMDDDHCESLISAVLPKLLDRAGKQVLLLTHSRSLASRACAVHSPRSHLLYRVQTGERWATIRAETSIVPDDT